MASDVRADSVKMPVMIFFAGAIAGCVLGLVAGAVLQRRSGRPNFLDGRGVATTIAVIALLVAAVALADSERNRDDNQSTGSAAPPYTTTTQARSSSPSGSSSTTTGNGSAPAGLVSVPNVSHPPLTRKDALAILKRAGLEVTIESLPLTNVPAGFVISQNPLPAALTTPGSTDRTARSAAAASRRPTGGASRDARSACRPGEAPR